MIGPSLRLRMLCQRVTLRRALQTSAFSQPQNCLVTLQLTCLNRNVNRFNVRFINTSEKNKDHHHGIKVYDPEWVDRKPDKGPETAKEFADVKSQKNWISYGFDYVDIKNDRQMFHLAMFTLITLSCITYAYGLYYFPDYQLNDWAIREAFMIIDERERLGLPLVSRDLVDPALIDLPTDEELGDYEVYT